MKCILDNKYSGDVSVKSEKTDDTKIMRLSSTSFYSALTSNCFFKIKNEEIKFKSKKVDESCFKKGKFGNIINTC